MKIFKLKSNIFLFLIGLTAPGFVLARDLEKLSMQDVVDIFYDIASWFAGIVASVAVIMILYAAFLYMTAGGDEDRVNKAKKTLIWAIVGVAVSLSAFGIFGIVKSFLGAGGSGGGRYPIY